MYSSSYSQVSKFSPAAKKKMHRSKGKSCGYYMRVIFFFSSLIQSLIIVSLVLFLVYGKQQDSASTARIQDLEQSFSRLSIENVALRQQRKNLTNFLNVTLTEKARNDWDLAQMYASANMSLFFLLDLNKRLNQCNMEKMFCKPVGSSGLLPCRPTLHMIPGNCNCGLQVDQLRAMVELVQSNFTQTTQIMKMEMEEISKDRDKHSLEAIQLRRDKSVLMRNLADFKVKCKDEFTQALSGLSNVSKAFLEKIDSLFPQHIAFQLTCLKQRENLEQIRTNCTNLSREVENKLQLYLNKVQSKMVETVSDNSQLRAENWRLTHDYLWCSQNRTALIQEHKQNMQRAQLMHDQENEKLLMEKRRLNGDKDVLASNINLKDKQIAHLNEQMRQLNYSCLTRTASFPASGGSPVFGGNTQSQSGSIWNKYNLGGSTSSSSSSSSSSSGNSYGRTGSSSSLGSTGVGLNKVGSNGIGSSSFGSNSGSKSSSTSLGSTGSGLNRLGSSGTGTSSSSGSSSGSTGSGSSFGSTGFGLNKPGSTNAGSSSSGSTGSSTSAGSSGVGLNKPGTSGKTSSTSGSKSGTGNSGFSFWSGFGSSSNSGQSKSGTGTGKGSTGGTSSGGSGTTFGGGRTSGLVRGGNSGQAVSVLQHLQDLQRIVNPSNSEDNQDLSRVLG